MDSESPGLAESFPALLTLERLLFGVNISEGKNRARINPCKMTQCYKYYKELSKVPSHCNEELALRRKEVWGYLVWGRAVPSLGME